MTSAWLKMSASDLGRGIAAGDIDPVDLTETYLAAMKKHNLTPRIYARATKVRARAEAKASQGRARSGTRRSLLDGVPISWKDLVDTAGTMTEAGSALLENRLPETDAEVLQNATRAGLVCLGKTHMTELAFSGLGLNPVTETPPCVNDPQAAPGGSSSGAATSVAFDLASAGIGSDTGGSVRIPATWNDLVGLKTTHGSLSLEGVVPLCKKFDTIGPLTRNVEDAARIWAAMGGWETPDLDGASIAGRHFLILENALKDVQETPLEAFDAAASKLRAAGAKVTRTSIQCVDDALSLSAKLFATEGYGLWKDVIEASPDKMFPEILERFRAGAEVSAPDYVKAWDDLETARRSYAAQTSGYDAVILPSSPIMPPNVDRLMNDHDYYVNSNLLALRNTRIGNLMGLAVLTLPTGTPSCGISFMGAPNTEARLLRIGLAAEAAIAA